MEVDHITGEINNFVLVAGITSMAEDIWKELASIINFASKGMKDLLKINVVVC